MQQRAPTTVALDRGQLETYQESKAIADSDADVMETAHATEAPDVPAYPDPEVTAPAPWLDAAALAAPDVATEDHPTTAGNLEGVYIISVAARLLEMHPQTLRKYERLGLIQPVRTVGMLRLYSQGDLRKVMLIRHLMDNLGLNLAGVEFVLKLVNNLNVFTRRLTGFTDDAELSERIREEVAALCDSLSLPTPHHITFAERNGNVK